MYFGFKNITVSYGRENILENVTVDVKKGEIAALVGNNGCGKSSLLKTFSRSVKPKSGEVVYKDRKISEYGRREIARKIAYLPQFCVIPEGITVEAYVSYGRYPYLKFGRGLTQLDKKIVAESVDAVGLSDICDRDIRLLSGGERRRAQIAMALCQKSEILILDEPVSHLDVGHQIEILDLIENLKRERGLTVLMVLHELNLASRYADRMIILNEKKVHASGEPHEILTAKNLSEIFGISAEIKTDSKTGTPYFIPLSARKFSERDWLNK